MMSVSPWVWIVLVVICFVAQGLFAHYHVDGAEMISTLFGVAVAGLWGRAHVSTSTALKAATLRPPPLPPASEPP